MRIIKGCGALWLLLLLSCSDGAIGDNSDNSEPPPFTTTGPGGFGGSISGTGTGGSQILGFGTYDQPLVVASKPPPPLSGGTLLTFDKGHKAAVSDPDRDQVVIVDLDALKVTSTIALQKGDEPGRLVADAAGVIHVVLRSAGAVAAIDSATGTLARRDAACSYPRGLAYEATKDAVHVACAGGELVTLSAKDGTTVRSIKLPRDLRDVVVDGDHLLVSRFRSAELLVLDPEGSLVSTIRPPGLLASASSVVLAGNFAPAVAWRTIAAPGGGAVMVHQQELEGDVQTRPGGYGGPGPGCGGIVRTAVSVVRRDGTGVTWPISAPLAIDVAVTDEPTPVTFLPSAGLRADVSVQTPAAQIAELNLPILPPVGSADAGLAPSASPEACDILAAKRSNAPGQVVAVAVGSSNQLVVQTREPAMIVIGDNRVVLPGDSRKDTGHELFHLATAAGIACASCHPEGRDDGHIWKFLGLGPRRTQSIGGGILGTEPFHWNGDMTDFLSLAHNVFNERMLGPSLQDDYVSAMAKWIDSIPAWKPAAPVDAAAIERGRTLFNGTEAGCSSCHAGAKFTNNTTVDVGTGGKFQVPSLHGVVWRAPFMHNGCAANLDVRFVDTCGGNKHGHIPAGDTARADLIAYLESL